MPCSPAKARLLLKEKKAIVKRRTPFTIQLTIATGEAKQPVTLGVDSGYKHIGLSATTEKAELYASQVELRQDITDLFVRPSCFCAALAAAARRATVRLVSTTGWQASAKAGLLLRWKTALRRTCRA